MGKTPRLPALEWGGHRSAPAPGDGDYQTGDKRILSAPTLHLEIICAHHQHVSTLPDLVTTPMKAAELAAEVHALPLWVAGLGPGT